jgi:hypothetical protein
MFGCCACGRLPVVPLTPADDEHDFERDEAELIFARRSGSYP